MSLTKFTENMSIISELPDAPTETAQELKAKFDEAGRKIKEYLNNTLTTETEHLVATEKTSLQTLIANTKTQLETEIGNVEDNIPNTQDDYTSSLTDTYNCDYINKINTYSTEEVIVGKWTDRKPIYRRTFNFTAAAAYDDMSRTYINLSNVKMIIKHYGEIECSDVPRGVPNKATSLLIIDSNRLRFDVDGNLSSASAGRLCHLTIEYTKTTD